MDEIVEFHLIISELEYLLNPQEFKYLNSLINQEKLIVEENLELNRALNPKHKENVSSQKFNNYSLLNLIESIHTQKCNQSLVCTKIISKISIKSDLDESLSCTLCSLKSEKTSSSFIKKHSEKGSKFSKQMKGYRSFIGNIQGDQCSNNKNKLFPNTENTVGTVKGPINILSGYSKSEDEIGLEILLNLSKKFNEWLNSFDGEKLFADSQELYKILRIDLEYP